MLSNLQDLSIRDEVDKHWMHNDPFLKGIYESLFLKRIPVFQSKLPKEYSWPDKKLKISILPDTVFDSPLQ